MRPDGPGTPGFERKVCHVCYGTFWFAVMLVVHILLHWLGVLS